VDNDTGQRVAVKVVVPEMAKDPEQRRLLRHELAVAQSLDFPAIVRIDEFSVAGGLPHLVMEFCPYGNLKKQASAGVDEIAPRLHRIITQVAWALDHMHGRGWVHRDVKPENVLASAEGEVRLIDLAIAARRSGVIKRLFGGKVKAQGSPSYIAPEQIRGPTSIPSAACCLKCSRACRHTRRPPRRNCCTSICRQRRRRSRPSIAMPPRASRS